MDCDVVVIGAGLAGLECARSLTELGRDVRVVEAADSVGGRVRSEKIDGFTVDRGFQLLNPAYPAVRERIDIAALDLQTFDAGVAARRQDRLAIVADPRRAPRRLGQTLTSGYVRPLELAALIKWCAPALGRVSRLLTRADSTLEESFVEAGVEGRLRREILEPFLAGVLADDSGQTSAAFVGLLVRTFLHGTPGVPAAGMGAFPRQIAERLDGRITLGARVEAIERADGGMHRVLSAGGSWTARAVVVATDPRAAAQLAGVAAPTMKGLVTHWYGADEPPTREKLLFVDGRRKVGGVAAGETGATGSTGANDGLGTIGTAGASGTTAQTGATGRTGASAAMEALYTRTGRFGPVVNAAVMSNVAPSYAPVGRHLVEVTCLLGSEAPAEAVVRRQAGEMFGCETSSWREITRHEIPQALPTEPAPLVTRKPIQLGEGRFVCGDHRDTASIQGALVSGRRTAKAVADSLDR